MKIYLIDTFTNKLFQGSPAAVVVLDEWCSDSDLVNLSRENAVPESAFLVKKGADYEIRWFTHKKEIRLCGHATLAAAYVVNHFMDHNCQSIVFHSLAGKITVACKPRDIYELCLKAFDLKQIEFSNELYEAVGAVPKSVYLGRDYLLVYEDEQTIREIRPRWNEKMDFDGKLISVTAKGTGYDCVSRTFVPHNRMAEEEACGSAHCNIAPYWSRKIGKNELKAYQASGRGGILYCRCENEKVLLSGACVLYMAGELSGIGGTE